MSRRPLDRETRVHRTFLVCLAAASLAAPASRAELNLPERTIVVRNFARKRQDLLDTLRVNLPDMKVEIDEFRGADVVLKIEVGAEVEDRDKAERTLRRHCDRLIRRAFDGMRLSEDSSFEFPTPVAVLDEEKKDIVSRLKNALASMRGEEEEGGAAPEGTPEDSDTEVAAAPSKGAEALEGSGSVASKERNGYLDSLRNAAEQRYRDLIARAKGEAPAPRPAASSAAKAAPPQNPPKLAAAVPTDGALSPSTSERMARYPAVPRPKPVGASARRQADPNRREKNWKARRDALRAKQEARRKLVSRISEAPNVSPQTLEAIQAYERGRTSIDTVRGIYAQIFQNRQRSTTSDEETVQVGAPMVTGTSAPVPQLAARPGPPASRPAATMASRPPRQAPPAPQTADALLGSKIEALFDSVEASEKGGRPGLSMVASSAPEATSNRQETP